MQDELAHLPNCTPPLPLALSSAFEDTTSPNIKIPASLITPYGTNVEYVYKELSETLGLKSAAIETVGIGQKQIAINSQDLKALLGCYRGTVKTISAYAPPPAPAPELLRVLSDPNSSRNAPANAMRAPPSRRIAATKADIEVSVPGMTIKGRAGAVSVLCHDGKAPARP